MYDTYLCTPSVSLQPDRSPDHNALNCRDALTLTNCHTLAYCINQVYAKVICVNSHCSIFKRRQIICKAKYRLYKWSTLFAAEKAAIYWNRSGTLGARCLLPWKKTLQPRKVVCHITVCSSLPIMLLDVTPKNWVSGYTEKWFQGFPGMFWGKSHF